MRTRPKEPLSVDKSVNGAGKTTLLNRVLNNRKGRRAAVIVNDTSEVNIDADLVGADTKLSRTDETLMEMSTRTAAKAKTLSSDRHSALFDINPQN